MSCHCFCFCFFFSSFLLYYGLVFVAAKFYLICTKITRHEQLRHILTRTHAEKKQTSPLAFYRLKLELHNRWMDWLELIIITALMLLLLLLLLLWLLLALYIDINPNGLFSSTSSSSSSFFQFFTWLSIGWREKRRPLTSLLFFSTFNLLILFQLKFTTFDGRGSKRWNTMTAADRKRNRHTQHQHREKKAYASEIMNTDTYFLRCLNQTKCFTWALLFSRISFVLFFFC